MAEEFRSDSTSSGTPNPASGGEEREPVRIMVIGSRPGVMEQIQIFHVKGIAAVDAWSPLLPAPNAGEVMSILTRWRKRSS
jgi:hypothetical protein